MYPKMKTQKTDRSMFYSCYDSLESVKLISDSLISQPLNKIIIILKAFLSSVLHLSSNYPPLSYDYLVMEHLTQNLGSFHYHSQQSSSDHLGLSCEAFPNLHLKLPC